MAEAAPSAPAAPAATPGNATAATAPASAIAAPPTATADQDVGLLKQLTKASSAERKANALVADLTKKLEAATGGMTEAQKDAALLAEVKKNPKKLLEMGLTWDNILDSISGKDDLPDDPRLAKLQAENEAIKKRIDDREKAETDAKDAATKAQVEAQQAAALAKVTEIVGAEGDVPGADGLGRWELVQEEPHLIKDAIKDVVDWMDAEVEAGRAKGFTQEQALGFVREHLDTYEAKERETKPKRVAKLKAAAAVTKTGTGDSEKAPQPTSKPRAELPPDRFSIDASTAGDPPPAALHKEPDKPRTRPARWT